MNDRNGLLVITNGNYFALKIVERLFTRHTQSVRGILLITGDYRAHRGLRSLWEVSRRTAFPYTLYKVFIHLVFRITESVFPDSCYSIERYARSLQIPLKRAVSVNSPDSVKWITARKPDLIVSVSCPQKIKPEILSIGRFGAINVHSSLLPSYAGLAPYFWVLSYGEAITGITFHYMTSRFDSGDVLVQKPVRVVPRESAFGLFSRLAELGRETLVEAIDLAFLRSSGIKQDPSRYSYYSNPRYSDYRRLRMKGHCLLRLKEIISVLKPLHRTLQDGHQDL